MHGLVTEIQRFSLHDGPGIRTTVFLKGCNMQCGWCHNPETISARPSLCYYPDRCIGCGRCVLACPYQAHQIKGTLHVIDRSLCRACGRCAAVCPTEALLMANAPAASVAELASKAELVLFDIKLIDPGAHHAATGADLTPVLENARLLAEMGIDLIVRTPLIPGVTDHTENVAGIAAFAARLASVRYYELLNFNPLGAAKYASLGLPYAFKDCRPLPPEKLSHLKAVAEAAGVTVKVS